MKDGKAGLVGKMRGVSLECNPRSEAAEAGNNRYLSSGHRDDLDSNGGHHRNRRKIISQYHENYQPMARGLRSSVWEEGFKQRCERKKSGFHHFKLEWNVPTDRSVGMRKRAQSVRNFRQNHHHSSNGEADLDVDGRYRHHSEYGGYGEARGSLHDLLEPLTLPPTKLEEKRLRLQRMYERRDKKAVEARLAEAKRKETAMGTVDGEGKILEDTMTDYEKNKLNNGKSHLDMPTYSTLGASTARSLPPSQTMRGTKD